MDARVSLTPKPNVNVINLSKTKWFPILLFGLMIFSILNFIINYYVINHLKLTKAGMNDGRFYLGNIGFQINSDTIFKKGLFANFINYPEKHDFQIKNENEILIQSENNENQILLGDKKIEIQSKKFIIKNQAQDEYDPKNNVAFELLSNEISSFIQDKLLINENGGFKINDILETSFLSGSYDYNLLLESRTKNLNLQSENLLELISKYQDIKINALEDIEYLTNNKITIDTPEFYLKNMKKWRKFSQKDEMLSDDDVLQVCTCENGKLFAVPVNSACYSKKSFVNKNKVYNLF